MIAANELRVGSKILSIFNQIETVRMILGHEGYKDREDVHEIYKYLIGVEENGNQYNLSEIKPIPLTEQVLLDCGFESVGLKYFWKHNGYRLEFDGVDWCVMPFADSEHVIAYISTLHQLQNAFWIITGKELNYQPKEI